MEPKDVEEIKRQILSKAKYREEDIKDIRHIEELQLLESNNEYCGLNENDVFLAKKEEVVDKKKVIIYDIYSKEGELIGRSDEQGNVELTEEYKEKLQEKYKEFYKKLGINKRKAKISQIEKYTEEKTEENEIESKEQVISEEENEVDKKENKKEIEKTDKLQENEQVEKMEQSLGLDPKDIKSSSEIKDLEFYKLVPEAKKYKGNVSIVYIGSTNEFMIVGVDRKTGQYKQLETVEASRAAEVGETNRTIDIGRDGSEVEAKSLKAVMNIKGDKEYSFAAKLEGINPIELKELRRDPHSGEYISADLETSHQYPVNEKVADMMDKDKNVDVRDEVDRYNKEVSEGKEVTTIGNIEDEKAKVNKGNKEKQEDKGKEKTPWEHLGKYGY